MRLKTCPRENQRSISSAAGSCGWAFDAGWCDRVYRPAIQGLNFGIDFRGGTTIRTESTQPVDVGAYRAALQR